MKNTLIYVIIILSLLITPILTYAQWNANLFLTQYPSPYFNDWQRNSSIGSLTVFYSGSLPAQFYFSVKVTNTRYGTVLTARSSTIEMTTPSQVFTNYEFVNWEDVNYDTRMEEMLVRTGRFPEGEFELCVRLMSLNNIAQTEACAIFNILYPNPPQLISPTNGETVLQDYPVFQWTPVITPPDYSVKYKIKIVERLPGQTPLRAIESNYPHHQDSVIGLSVYNYPPDALPLINEKEYVWQIHATDEEGFAPSSNNGKSEIWSFFYGSAPATTGTLPIDTLPLVENLASLINLRTLSVTEDAISYTLNGNATLLLTIPTFPARTISVFVNNLVLSKGNYRTPTYTSGSLRGNLTELDLPTSFINRYIRPRDVEFTPPANLTVGGELTIPEARIIIPFPERFGLTGIGLSGISSIIRSATSPLFTIGEGITQIKVTKATINFSEPVLRLGGLIQLFGVESTCEVNDLVLSTDGTMSGDIFCGGNASIPLGSDKFKLNINSLSGNLSLNLSSGSNTFDFVAIGGLDFQPADTTRFGADIVLNIRSDGVSVQSFNPRGDLSFSSIDLGWLALRLSNLSLSSLSYTSGRWNFNLGMDLQIILPTFDNLTLPPVSGVTFSPSGFNIPSLNLPALLLPSYNFEQFELEFISAQMPALNFPWFEWRPGSLTDFNLSFDVKLKMPNLPAGISGELRNPDITMRASFGNGVFTATIPPKNFADPGLSLPLGEGINFRIYEIAGTLSASVNGSSMTASPDVRIRGKLELPPFFTCSGTSNDLNLLTASLRMSGIGKLIGTIENIVPPCPLQAGILTLLISNSSLTFNLASDSQRVQLDGSADLQINGPTGTPIRAAVTLSYEFIRNQLLSLNGNITNPFVWNIPPISQPALSFNIARATINEQSIILNGRNSLALPGGVSIGVTFDNLNINWRNFSILSGRALFDVPFAFKVAIDGSDLRFEAVPRGTELTEAIGIILNLPDTISIERGGFKAQGRANIQLKYEGRNLTAIEGVYSPDFAFSLNPFGVSSGQVDFYYGSNRIALINSRGFFPDLSYFGLALLPERLPLPVETIAYLVIKSGETFLIDYSTVSGGVRLNTRPGQPVRLVLPALQLGRPTPPELLVNFDITIDAISRNLSNGSISVTIPNEKLPDFDLSRFGLPFAIKSLLYGELDGLNAFQFTGQLKLFDNAIGNDTIRLKMTPDGRLLGSIDFNINQNIPLVTGSDKLNLNISRVNGSFDAQLVPLNLNFDFNLSGGIRLNLGEGRNYGASARLGVTQSGIELREFRVDSLTTPPRLNLSWLNLGLSDFTIPRLTYNPIGGWDFEIGIGVEFELPDLNFRLPKVSGITITRSGICIPDISIPELSDSTHTFMGFGIKPLAFRMRSFTFNWFNFSGSSIGDWGFAFDFELSFPQLPEGVPPALRNPRVTILNAGYQNGKITGNIETKSFEAPGLQLPLGGTLGMYVREIGGNLSTTGGVQNFNVTFRGNLQLPEFMRCSDDPGIANTMATAFNIDSRGRLSGTINGFIPPCPIDLGIGKLRVTNSNVTFSFTGDRQSAIIDLAGVLRIPRTTPGDSISASGNLSFDLISGDILSGEIAITSPFRWQIPSDSPILVFTINNAVLNREGLRISGSSNLNLSGGATAGVTFDNFLINYRDFRVLSGRATFSSQFALKFIIESGGLQWSAVPTNTTITEQSAVRLTLPTNVSLGANGLMASGETNVFIRFNGTDYDAIRCVFSDSFAISLTNFRVSSGRADFYLGDRFIARLDRDGFQPGDIFGIIPIPEKLPLPDTAIAYLRLKDGDRVLVQTEPVTGGIRISTRTGEQIQLVIPALQYSRPTPPTVGVSFSVTINTSTFEFVDGSINVAPPTGLDTLFSLASFGIPLNITRLQYVRIGGAYGLMASAKIALPEALGGVVVNLDTLSISREGFSGTVRLGNYTTEHRTGESYIASVQLGSMATFKVSGVEAIFGSGLPTVRLSGDITTELFRNDRGDTAAIHYTAQWASGRFGFSFDVTHLPDAKLPLMIANFKPQAIGANPAFDLSFLPGDIRLTLSGVLSIPSFGDSFAVSFSGLQISKNNITLPEVSITLPSAIQQFNLFGARFELKDLTSPDARAISFAYESRVFYVILNGEITFLDNKSQFRGLRIGSNGSISITGATLLNRIFYVVDPYIAVDTLSLVSNNLRVTGFVKLPEPCDTSRQRFYFQISPNGSITGGADVLFIDERAGLGSDDRTEYDFWIAKFDPTYLVLNLNVANIRQSSLKFVADVYFMNNVNKKLQIGNRSGGIVNPGLEIKFDRTLTWANINASGLTDIDWEALKVNIPTIGTVGGTSDFKLSMTGNISINAASVGGSLSFENLRLNSRGRVENFGEAIRGGNLTIVDVVTISVSSVEYSDAQTTIWVKGGNVPSGSTPASSDSQQVTVRNYFRFGANISIGGSGGTAFCSGGIEEFLTYRTIDGTTNIIIRNANLEIRDVITFRVDLKYQRDASGYYLLAGGKGKLANTYEIIVIGKIAKSGGTTSAGFFVAASVNIPIPPAILLTQIGGGFFYNPTSQDINLVRNMAGLDDTTRARINVEPGRFAVLIYAGATVVQDYFISGRVLLTVTERYFALYGRVVLLNQTNYLNGNIYLMVGFRNGFAEGNINVAFKVSSLIEAKTSLGFYVYSQSAWGITGNINAKILNLLNASGELFIGNPGFYLTARLTYGFDIWIIKVEAGFEGSIWYIRNVSWGAYCKAWVEASVLAGIVAAKGWLEGALFGEPNFYIYGVAGLRIRVLFVSWSGSVWAKIYSGGTDGGFGRDPEMEKLIQEAKDAAEEMEEARDAAQEELRNAQMAVFQISREQLQQAFVTLFRMGQLMRSSNPVIRAYFTILVGAIMVEESRNLEPLEIGILNWVVNNILTSSDAPPPTLQTALSNERDQIDQLIQTGNNEKNRLVERLGQITTSLTELTSREFLLAGNPVTSANLNPPITTTTINENSDTIKVVSSQPDFSFNSGIAQQNVNTLNQAQNEYGLVEEEIRNRITELERGLQTIDSIIAGTSTGISTNRIGTNYLNIVRKVEEFFKNHTDYLFRESQFALNKKIEISSAPSLSINNIGLISTYRGLMETVTYVMTQKTNRLNDDGRLYVTRRRIELLLTFAGVSQDSINDRISAINATWNTLNDEQKKAACTNSGIDLWYNMHVTGLSYLDSIARNRITENPTLLSNELYNNLDRFQSVFTNALSEIYDTKVKLTECLYDVYNRYAYWKQEQPDSIKVRPLSLTYINNRKNILKQMLEVPRVNSININSTNRNFFNETQISWYGYHPRGISEYAMQIFRGTYGNQISDSSLLSVGNNSSMTRYFLKRPGENSVSRSVFIRARGGAGYTNQRLANFTTHFSTSGGGSGVTTGSSMLTDASAPYTPSVNFPHYKYSPSYAGAPTSSSYYYSSDIRRIIVTWRSSDPQSGIIEYQYSVGTSPRDSSVLNWQSAGGRTEVIILGLNLIHNQRYYVNVRARNGVNLWSNVGYSRPLQIDTSRPSSPGVRFVVISTGMWGVSSSASSSVTVIPPVPLPAELATSTTELSIGVGISSNFGIGTGPTFSLNIIPDSPPVINVYWNASNDAQSGIYEYQYRLTSKTNPLNQSKEWISAGNVTEKIISGDILRYLDSFYVDIKAVNYAGLESEPTRFGPYRPIDPTPPSKPTAAVSYGIPPGTTYLIFSSQSVDNETFIRGYQIAIGTTPGAINIRNWNDSIDFRPTEIRTANSYRLPNFGLPNGTYYVSIRAKNKDGLVSAPCITGPYYVDSSPPITPVITPTLQSTSKGLRINMSFSNVSDPQSGIAKIEYAMGSSSGNPNMRSWVAVSSSATTAYPPSILLTAAESGRGRTYFIGARTTNTVGLVSQEFWTSITLP